jgi:hypothetical protein
MGAPTEKSANLASEKDASSKPEEDPSNSYTTLNLGVWRVLLPNEIVGGGFLCTTKQKWNSIVLAYPVVRKFFQEIYALHPHLFILLILLKLWGELESVVMLYVSGCLLRIVRRRCVMHPFSCAHSAFRLKWGSPRAVRMFPL